MFRKKLQHCAKDACNDVDRTPLTMTDPDSLQNCAVRAVLHSSDVFISGVYLLL